MTKTHQMRLQGETKWYAPARDITCFTPSAISAAFRAWEDESNEYRRAYGELYDDSQVGQAAEALAKFVSVECVVEPETYVEALEKSGWADVPVTLRIIVLALVGDQFLSAFWVGIRGATTDDGSGYQINQYDPDVLVERAGDLSKLMRMPRWRRRFHFMWDRVRRRIIGYLKGDDERT